MTTYFELRLSKFLGYCLDKCREINIMFNVIGSHEYEDGLEFNTWEYFSELFIGYKGYDEFKESLKELVSL